MDGPAQSAGPFMHNVAEHLHTSAGNLSQQGSTNRDGFPRAHWTTGQPACAVEQGISSAVPATAWSCAASAAWIPAFAGMTAVTTTPDVSGAAPWVSGEHRWISPVFAGAKDTGQNNLSIQRVCPFDWEGDWRPFSGKSISVSVLKAASMTASTLETSFPRRRESMGVDRTRRRGVATRFSPSFPYRCSSSI